MTAQGFTSSIFEQPMTLYRLGMQLNLASSLAQALFTSTGQISRVTLFYSRYGFAPAPERTLSLLSQ